MSWTDEFGAAFFVTIGTMVAAGIGVAIRYLYKTKVDECHCCGCITIKRNVDRETELDLARLDQPVTTPASSAPPSTAPSDAPIPPSSAPEVVSNLV